MSEFIYILLNISLPIIIMILLGFGFQKLFKTDSAFLVKFSVYILLPVMLFAKVYDTDLNAELLLTVIPYIVIFMAAMFIISQVFALIMKYGRPKRKAIGNVYMLTNTGNYGIPLIALAFPGSSLAMASQIIIILCQNIITSTFGVYQVSSGNSSAKKALKNVIKMPALYAIIIAIIVKNIGFEILTTIKIPLDYITDTFVALALITLGVRLADVKSFCGIKSVIAGTVLRMLIAPVIAFGIVKLLGITGILAQALIIGISTPAAVTTAIIAQEFDNEADFTAQFVLATTVFCTFTLPFVIYFVPKLL